MQLQLFEARWGGPPIALPRPCVQVLCASLPRGPQPRSESTSRPCGAGKAADAADAADADADADGRRAGEAEGCAWVGSGARGGEGCRGAADDACAPSSSGRAEGARGLAPQCAGHDHAANAADAWEAAAPCASEDSVPDVRPGVGRGNGGIGVCVFVYVCVPDMRVGEGVVEVGEVSVCACGTGGAG